MGFGDDDSRLDALELTYLPVGATRGEMPAGYHHLERAAVLGRGRQVFSRAAGALMGWRMHRGAGLGVWASAPRAVPGAVVLLRFGVGPAYLTAGCRVVYVVEETDRCGFAYGTLAGHPESGEESFVVERGTDDVVRCTVRAFSRPATPLARLGGPLSRKVQALVTARYLRALRRLSQAR